MGTTYNLQSKRDLSKVGEVSDEHDGGKVRPKISLYKSSLDVGLSCQLKVSD